MKVQAGAAVLFCLAAVLAAEEPKRTSPTVAREAADSNAKTPVGRRYESAFQSSLDSWLRKSLERCVKSAPKDELISFDALVRIAASGQAEEVLLAPETAVGRCTEPEFRDAKYPSPPEAAWWMRVEVGLK